MQLLLMYPTRATLWTPCDNPRYPSRPLTQELVIPAYSKIEIQGGGIAFDGTIIVDIQGNFSLYINPPLPGNINFHDPNPVNANPYRDYKIFDPIEATSEKAKG
jgi:hypothetical protein